MDIQTKKMQFIEDFIRINDESVINKLIDFLKLETEQEDEKEMKPYTLDEFNELIDRSESDSKHGREISAQDLKNEIDSWS
jgi:hypothetical protein